MLDIHANIIRLGYEKILIEYAKITTFRIGIKLIYNSIKERAICLLTQVPYLKA